MDWMGIGVLLIGAALLIVSIILIKPLNKLTEVLDNVKKTTDELPETVQTVTSGVSETMQTTNATLQNVNEQISEISPFFHVVGDTGTATRQLTLAALEKTNALKAQTTQAAAFSKKEKYEGIFKILSFVFFLTERRKDFKETLPKDL